MKSILCAVSSFLVGGWAAGREAKLKGDKWCVQYDVQEIMAAVSIYMKQSTEGTFAFFKRRPMGAMVDQYRWWA